MRKNNLFQATINATIIHLIFIGCLIFFKYKQNQSEIKSKKNKAIEVTRISSDLLKKYRTVGTKKGKNYFSLKTPKGVTKKPEKKLSLKNLKAKINSDDFKKKRTEKENNLKKDIKNTETGTPLTAIRTKQAIESFKRQEYLRRNLSKNLSPQSREAQVLKRTGFNLHFDPPRGISEDELNSVEKIFYSFQKRTFLGYVNSFLSAYRSTLLTAPQIEASLRNEKHILTGKIVFDRKGNILRIKILRSSHNDNIHQLFEKTLKEIRKLPNPPKAVIEDREQFTIYYQLKVN